MELSGRKALSLAWFSPSTWIRRRSLFFMNSFAMAWATLKRRPWFTIKMACTRSGRRFWIESVISFMVSRLMLARVMVDGSLTRTTPSLCTTSSSSSRSTATHSCSRRSVGVCRL